MTKEEIRREFEDRFRDGLSSPRLIDKQLVWNNVDDELLDFIQETIKRSNKKAYEKGRQDVVTETGGAVGFELKNRWESEAVREFTVYLFKLGEGNKTEIAEMFIKDRLTQKEEHVDHCTWKINEDTFRRKYLGEWPEEEQK